MKAKAVLLTGVLALVIIGCILAAGCTSQDSAYQPERVYDLETHYYLPEFLDYLSTRTEFPYMDEGVLYYSEGISVPINRPSFNYDSVNLYEERTNIDQIRLDMMEIEGITSVLVSSSEGIENVDKESAVKYAQLTNDAVAAAAKKYPGRIIGTITLPTPYVEESIAELERAVNELGLQYWNTHSSYGDERLSDAKFEPLIAKCAELNVPIYLHPVYSSSEYLTDSGAAIAGVLFGFSVDTMKTMLNLIIGGTFDKYPNLQMILGHAGEYFPYALERMDNRLDAAAAYGDPSIKCKENISYYFRNGNLFITTSGITDQQVILLAIDSVGIDHIMFASDYPYETVNVQVESIKSLPISDEDKDKIFYRNAETYILKDRTPNSA